MNESFGMHYHPERTIDQQVADAKAALDVSPESAEASAVAVVSALRRAGLYIADMAAVPAMPEHRKWLVHLICCGRDDGTWPCASWEEADALRTSYIDPSTGHDRSAVITVRGAVLPVLPSPRNESDDSGGQDAGGAS